MVRPIPLISRSKYYLLIAIALIALVEKGAPPVGLPQGASPLNTGELGTFDFYETLKDRYYHVTPVVSIKDLEYPENAEYCLFVTISPEEPYTREEAELVISKLMRCRNPALLVADEFSTSNILLEAAGFSARIPGWLILSFSGTGNIGLSPYVRAVFTVEDKPIEISLDKASFVIGGKTALGYAEDIIVVYNVTSTHSIFLRNTTATVAVYDASDKLRGIVISDGSIFLNQVLRSRLSSNYTRILLYYIDYLCSFKRECAIVIDASKYRIINPEDLFLNATRNLSMGFSPHELLPIAVLLVFKLIHPSTWLPPLLKFTGDIALSLYTNPYFSSILPLATAIFVAGYILSKLGPRVRDEKAEEVKEVEVYTTADIISAIVKGRYKLTKKDFIALYDIVNYYLKYTYGCGLNEPVITNILSKYIDAKKASRYVSNMNKLYLKAIGKRKLPIVLSWSRTVKRCIKQSEEILRLIGYSLEAEKGYEYIAMRVLG